MERSLKLLPVAAAPQYSVTIREKMMKKVRELAEIVLRDSPFAWWEWDIVNNKVTMNDLKVTMLGYQPDDFRGKGYEALTALLHPDDYERTMEAMRDVLTGKKKIYQIDYRIRDVENHYHWYMDRGVVIETVNGSISRMRGIVIDLGQESSAGTDTDALVSLLQKYSDNQNQLIILCASCKKVKIKEHEWTPVTENVRNVITDTISHGICPSCLMDLYPDIAPKILARMK